MAYIVELKVAGKTDSAETYIRETEQEAKNLCDEMNALGGLLGFLDGGKYVYREFLGNN